MTFTVLEAAPWLPTFALVFVVPILILTAIGVVVQDKADD